MVFVHIDTIHGDHLVHAPAARPFDLSGLASPSKIVAAAPGASEIRLQRFAEAPVWRAETPDGPRLFDRSEEHTSELQSLMRISYAVFCLKKKQLQILQHQHDDCMQHTTDPHNYNT